MNPFRPKYFLSAQLANESFITSLSFYAAFICYTIHITSKEGM